MRFYSYIHDNKEYKVDLMMYWDKINTMKKREYYKQSFYNRRYRMYGHLNSEDQLVNALVRAAIHARTVAVRSKFITPANMRAGEFVTSLRREIKETVTYCHRDMCSVEYWHDILEPRDNRLSKEVRSAVAVAKARINNRSTAEVIDEELDRVNNEVSDAICTLREIDTLNLEADIILNDF